jgi:DNA topoisomerase VI subunit B
MTAAKKLERVTFRTSRMMDFFNEKELVTQTGHARTEWPLVIIKELVDNALDACDEADIAPVVEVTADAAGIGVRDNGPGLPEATLQGALDFSVRVSNREAYVAPDRGAQGNALKTLLPMPNVLDPASGKFIVEAHGRRHAITCGADPISQQPVIRDAATDQPTRGTWVRLEWAPRDDRQTLWPFGVLGGHAEGFRSLVEGFALFNPHATIRLDWFGEKAAWEATLPHWEKWKPCQPTSAHWYEPRHLERLIGAYITKDRQDDTDRLVRDFLACFDGLTGSAKRTKVLDETGLKRVRLSELVVNDRLDSTRIEALLAAMRRHTRPVRSERLGLIGEEHLRARFLGMGIVPESFSYDRKLAKSKNAGPDADDKPRFLPWVVESAFGWLGPKAADRRRIFTGVNWSAAIGNPFRSFGSTGEGLETVLADMRATSNEPLVIVLHLAQPRVEYRDRGKSQLVIPG